MANIIQSNGKKLKDTSAARMSSLAPVESSATASAAHAVGDYFWLNGTLYEATAAIAIGNTITVGTNCEVAYLGSDVSNLKTHLTSITMATTTDEGKALKAKTVTNGRVTQWEFGEAGGTEISNDLKIALLQLASKVAYIDADGQDYYDDLYDALYPLKPATAISLNINSLSFTALNVTQTLIATLAPPDSSDTIIWSSSNTSIATVNNGAVTSVGYGSAIIAATAGNVSVACSVVVAQATVQSINAVYTQSGTVYDTDSLDSLKTNLVVTAMWSDSTTSVVPSNNYTLSGTLTAGTSIITVSYGGKSDTFTTTVTATLASISAVYTQSGIVYPTDSLDDLKTDLVVTGTWTDTQTITIPSTDYTLTGSLAVGTSTVTVSYSGKTTTFSVIVTAYTPVSEIREDWNTIVSNIDNGTYVTKYEVGNYKTLDLGTEGVVHMQIVAMDTDIDANNNTVPITFISMEQLASGHGMETSDTNANDWTGTNMRTQYLDNTIMNLLPNNIQSHMISVKKTSRSHTKAANDLITYDKLWLPSVRELFNGTSGQSNYEETSGVTYSDIFTNNDARIRRRNGTAGWYWLRSANWGNATSYRVIKSDGTLGSGVASGANAVVIGFCLGQLVSTS